MKKRNYIIIIGLFVVMFGCKVKIPHTEKECVLDSKVIINYIKHSEYEELTTYIHKYKDFQNYNKEDLQKEFTPLQKALENINIDKLQHSIKKDTITIDYVARKEYMINININYFTIDNSNHDIPVCEFRYTQEHNENFYQLTFFDHSYRVKMKPIMPKGIILPK